MKKRVLLFDIDGTLTTTVYNTTAGDVHQQLMSKTYNVAIDKKDVVYSGSTDRLIWKNLLAANGLEYNDTAEEIEKIMSVYRELIHGGIKENWWRWKILPNVNELLERCSKEEGFILALLTGNMIETAEVKLTNAGVNVEVFKDANGVLRGGFGSDDMDRATIVAKALKKLRAEFGKLDQSQFLIIGDTPKDVKCAHDNDFGALAVATGIYSAKSLAQCACGVVEDFSDVEKTVQLLKNTSLREDYKSVSYQLTVKSAADP